MDSYVDQFESYIATCCTTCYFTAELGYDESLVLHEDQQEAERIQDRSLRGLKKLHKEAGEGSYVIPAYELEDHVFNHYPCEVCGDPLHGYRHNLRVVLTENLHTV